MRPIRNITSEDEEIENLKKELQDFFDFIDGNTKEDRQKLMAIIEADGGDPLEMFQNALFQTVSEDQWVTYKDYLELMLEGWKKFKDMDLKRP